MVALGRVANNSVVSSVFHALRDHVVDLNTVLKRVGANHGTDKGVVDPAARRLRRHGLGPGVTAVARSRVDRRATVGSTEALRRRSVGRHGSGRRRDDLRVVERFVLEAIRIIRIARERRNETPTGGVVLQNCESEQAQSSSVRQQ
jgi:hypothetical protein